LDDLLERWRAIDFKVHRAIDNEQIIVLTTELLKERLGEAELAGSTRLNQDLELIDPKATENADALHEIIRTLEEERLNALLQ
jgi:hypothetical protein